MILNVEGGAVAHGHPIGATGAVLVTRLMHAMRRARIRRGLVTMCIGRCHGPTLIRTGREDDVTLTSA